MKPIPRMPVAILSAQCAWTFKASAERTWLYRTAEGAEPRVRPHALFTWHDLGWQRSSVLHPGRLWPEIQ